MKTPEEIKMYKKAGRIAAVVKEEVIKILKPGIKILTVTEFIERKIEEKGASCAFPPNISINEIAAHYTPRFNDDIIIKPGDLVKIDIGVHVDGYIGDLAFTYCSEKNDLVKTSETVLSEVIKIIKPGVTVSEISETIEETVKREGFGVIVNLTGHTIDRYVFHGEPSIPNVRNNINYAFDEGDIIAIEPFITEGNGHVRESGNPEIFRFLQSRPVRSKEARKIISLTEEKYKSLPFAKRWLCETISPVKLSLALKQLEDIGAIESYPPLKEIENKKIAQAEHTIIVSDKPIITTKI
jgi:methionyl aminopeptidase